MISYTYSPLPPGSFTRMIRLLPHRERDAPIECILIDYDLLTSERRSHLYEALSYTWGSNHKPHSIVIDGCFLPVTENLHTAQFYLRDHELERILWVDAICINQKDEFEKNTQIPLMRAIYAQADRVTVWLGEPDHTGDNPLVTIHQLAESKVLMNSKTESVDSSKADHDACMRLLRHDWFRRIWVLQEFGVARSIMIQCGIAQVNGYAFREGLSRLDISLLPEYVLPVIHLVPSITAPTSLKQTSDAGEQELRCRQLVVEEIFALILRLFDHERQIEPIKRLLCQSLVQIPVGQRALEAAAEHALEYELLKLLLDGQRKNRLITETSINNAKDIFELMGLLFRQINDVSMEEGVTKAAASSRGLEEIRLPYKHQKQLPISERTLLNAVGNTNAFAIIRLFYQHQDSLPISEEVVNVVVESDQGIKILQLVLEHEKVLPISATTVQLAITFSHRLDMLHFLQQCQNSLPISEQVVRAAINHDDGLAILRLLYQHERNQPISQQGISDAVMGPDAFEILNLLYQFQENFPISYSTIQTIAAGLWRPVSQKMLDMSEEGLSPTEDDGPVLTATKPDYEYSRECLRLIYQHQRDVVLGAATDFDFEDRIKAMLRDIDEKESERLY